MPEWLQDLLQGMWHKEPTLRPAMESVACIVRSHALIPGERGENWEELPVSEVEIEEEKRQQRGLVLLAGTNEGLSSSSGVLSLISPGAGGLRPETALA